MSWKNEIRKEARKDPLGSSVSEIEELLYEINSYEKDLETHYTKRQLIDIEEYLKDAIKILKLGEQNEPDDAYGWDEESEETERHEERQVNDSQYNENEDNARQEHRAKNKRKFGE